jgi:hypothetical protein
MIRKGTRVKIVEVGEYDAFHDDNLVGVEGITSTALRTGADNDGFYYGGIKIDHYKFINPWFAYVKVEVLRKRRKK